MAKTVKNKNTDVIELEVIEDVPLDVQIDNTLQKHNVTAAVIAGLKEKYGGMKLAALDDKESFLEIKQARKEVRQWGILCERITKKGREDAVAIQRKWLEKEKSVLAQIAEVQDPLDAEIKKYEDEQERIANEAAQKREEAYIKRQSQLLKMGASYDNGSFVLNHISYEISSIKDSDDEIWAETILPKYQREYEKNEAVRVAEEKKREEAAEALRKQQEEMDRQRQDFEAKQAEFKKQQDEAAQKERDRLEQIRKEEAEKERMQRMQQQKEEDERREKNRQRLEARANQLRALGMSFNFQYDCYAFEDVNIDNKTELCLWTDEEWEAKIKEIAPVIEERKAEAERKRLAKIESDKQEAIAAAALAERQKIEREQREAQEKAHREAALKAEEALKAKDSEKWQAFVSAVTGVAIPEMKSPSYKSRVVDAQKLLQKITML